MQYSADSAWEMRITLFQLILLWAVVLLMVLIAFFFGFSAGRDAGLAGAMEDYGAEAVRVELASPVAMSGVALSGAGAPGGRIEPVRRDDSSAVSSPNAKRPEEVKIDFSAAQTLPSVDADAKKGTPPEAGFATKPALEMFKGETAKVGQELEKPANPPLAVAKATPAKADGASSAGAKSSPAVTTTALPSKIDSVSDEKLVISTASESGLQMGWYIQVAATRARHEAVSLSRSFSRGGFPVVIEEAKVKNRTYYRVLVGAYSSRALALQAKDGIARARLIRSEPFLKHVK
jgi:cell division protein FtsN